MTETSLETTAETTSAITRRRSRPGTGGTSSRSKTATVRTRSPKTKTAQLIKLLSTKTGKDLASLSAALGWQPHSTRAALSRLRKAGYELARLEGRAGGAARYRIASKPAGQPTGEAK
ncbi:MAG: DUF3489 domain-containing protein [Pseudomonadota bacterium]